MGWQDRLVKAVSAKAPVTARRRVSYGRRPVVYGDPNGAREQQVPRYGQYHSSAFTQVSGPPTTADVLEAYLSSFIADRTPSTPEARAYAARHQGNMETSYSAQQSRRAADRRSSPEFADKQAVTSNDTVGSGMAQSNWQAPLEQPSTTEYDWEAEAAGAETEIQASMPEAALTSSVSEDGDVSDTSNSCDLSYAASEVDGVSDCTEGAEECLAPVNSMQTTVATTIQEGTTERGDYAAATGVTEVDTDHCEQLTVDLSSADPTVRAEAP